MPDTAYYAKILLVEDDCDLADNIIDYLEPKGFVVHHYMNGPLGLNALVEETYDAILLDVKLPGFDGLSLCEYLRKEKQDATPVLMITAADALEDRLAGFKAGTDDYVVKPFALQEIEARLVALLRRAGGGLVTQADLVTYGELVLNPGQMRATRAGQELELTNIGFRILLVLTNNAPNIVRRETMETSIWGDDPPGSDALRSHIFSVRQVLDRHFKRPMLKTIRGIGFQLIRS